MDLLLTMFFFLILKEQMISHLPFLGPGKSSAFESVPFMAKLNVIFRPEIFAVKKKKFKASVPLSSFLKKIEQ